jgi:lipopolysaccharide/colanic/teichoic acid biosynthesis glycosyltransferase
MIAIANKLSSAGPVFCRQLRIGYDGKPFQVVKFRTMVVGRRDGSRIPGSPRSVNSCEDTALTKSRSFSTS